MAWLYLRVIHSREPYNPSVLSTVPTLVQRMCGHYNCSSITCRSFRTRMRRYDLGEDNQSHVQVISNSFVL